MKKNKKRLLISILVLFVVWCSILVFIIIGDNNNKEEKDALGIENITTLDNINIKIGNDFYVRDEGEKLVIYDFNNNFISEYTNEYTYFEIFDKRLIIITNKNRKMIITKNGHEMVTGSHVKYSQDNKYILVDNAVYDYNLRKVYVLDFTGDFEYSAEFADDLLIINSYQKNDKSVIVDLNTKKVLWSDFISSSSYNNEDEMTYFRFSLNNKGYLLDVKTKQIVYEDITYKDESYMDYNTFTYKDNIMYIDNGVLYGENTKINNKYVMNKDNCDKGYKLKDSKNNIVVNKCMYAYKELFDDAILGIDEDNYILFYKDKEISGGEITLEGDYIKVAAFLDLLGDGTTYKYYDKNLKQIDVDENTNITYLSNNFYSGYNYSDYKTSTLDKDLNVIENNLNNIVCNNNGYCDVSKGIYEHYLYKDGKKLVNDTFVNITINEDEIILETLYKTYIIKLGIDKNIKLDFSFNFNIDIDDIISKYDLKDIEFKINKNEDLFKKFTYIIENNYMLLDHKKEVYDLFEVIADNKNYLDEFYFLHKLGYLNIHNTEVLHEGKAAGTYQDFNTRIDLSSDIDRVIYHELIHFVDYSIKGSSSTILYKCGDKIDLYEAVPNIPDGCYYVSFPYSNYITEAGAESFTSKYFTKEVLAYNFATYYLNALEYIYGSDTLNKWYYGDHNYFVKTLYEEFNDEKVVTRIFEALRDTTSLDRGPIKDIDYLMDILIDLYKKHNGEDYLSDKKFTFLLRPMLGYDNVNKSKYYNEFKVLNNMDYGTLVNLKNEIGYENYSTHIDPIIVNDKMYLSWSAWNSKVAKSAVIWINYDFDNDKINDYVVVEK